MKKFISMLMFGSLFFFGGSTLALAESTTTPTSTPDTTVMQSQIAQLLQQIEQLKAQLAELQKGTASLKSEVMQLTARLHKGMRGDEVKQLQEVLSTDKDIFSKDNVSGYYGDLTEKAVERFQKHFGLDPVGQVGPKTLEKINELLKEHDSSEGGLSENDLGDLGKSVEMENESEKSGNEGSASTSPKESEGERGGN